MMRVCTRFFFRTLACVFANECILCFVSYVTCYQIGEYVHMQVPLNTSSISHF